MRAEQPRQYNRRRQLDENVQPARRHEDDTAVQRGPAKPAIGLVLLEIAIDVAFQRRTLSCDRRANLRMFGLGCLIAGLGRPLQPDFAPIRIDGARTEAPADGITRFANDTLENDRVALEANHLSGPLVDDLLLPALDLVFPLGKRYHFGV